MKNIIPQIITILTGKPRYMPKIEWSDKSWTHNAFRLWELVCGRRYGIRAEASISIEKGIVTRQFHSVEASLAYIETCIREALSFKFKFKVVKVYLPVFATPEQNAMLPSQQPYLFAIAFDATGNGGEQIGSSDSFAFTTTGSDRLLWGALCKEDAGTVSSMSYNSVALTQAVAKTYTARTEYATLWYLAGPATGSNTFSGTYSASVNGMLSAMSYSGCKQTGIPDATASGEANATSITVAVTTVANNSWAVWGAYSQRAITAGTNTVVRNGNTRQPACGDNNGAITPAGSYSMTLNIGSGGNVVAMAVASFAPTGATYTIDANAGTFTLTGIATGLLIGINMVASVATFTLTGIANILSFGRVMATTVATFTLTGFDVIFYYGKILIAETGTFVLTGVDAIISSTRTMIADTTSFVLTGIDSIFSVGKTLVADVATFTLTGIDAILSYGRGIIASAGTFTLTGIDATFSKTLTMIAGVGSFTLTFWDIVIRVTGWRNPFSKNTISATNTTKNSESWINQSKS